MRLVFVPVALFGGLLASAAAPPAGAANCPPGEIDTSTTTDANNYSATSAACTATGSIAAPVAINLGGPAYNQLTFTNQARIATDVAGVSSVNLLTFGIPLNAGNGAYTSYNYLVAPPITATNTGSITLGGGSGSSVAGLLVTSTGAAGIADGNTDDSGSAPNNHYTGRNGGAVAVENAGAVTSQASGQGLTLSVGGLPTPNDAGINAESIGGAGVADKHGQGSGGDAAGTAVQLDPGSAVSVQGQYSAAVMAVSLGGQGSGYSQDSTHNYDSGGDAGAVTVTHSGTIDGGTGPGNFGILALSAGGASGATDNQYSLKGGNGSTVTVNLGGSSVIRMSGGNGIGVFAASVGGLSWYADNGVSGGHQNGNGGNVTVTMGGGASIATAGELGAGIVAASTGGNANTTQAPPDSEENGGAPNAVPTTRAPAGNAGAVAVTSTGTITTSGNVGIGIAGVSATGGTVIRQLASGPDSIDTVGGGSGTPGTVSVSQNSGGSVATTGAAAIGLLGLSVGGSGGVLDTVGTTLYLLGSGSADPGIGGNTVTLTNNGGVTTQGAAAIGLLAESVGGGGGTATGTGGIGAVGSQGGAGGNGGDVSVSGGGTIQTAGDGAFGILAHSIGGGGGNGGNATGVAVAVGGQAGSGGWGGSVAVTIGGAVHTAGDFASAVVAQSVGGGGGNGGYGKDFTPLSLGAAIGGIGGDGGLGGLVQVTSGASIATSGQHSYGILAQSVGGGGGIGGSATTGTAGVEVAIAVSIGGSGGNGGAGVLAAITNNGSVTTSGPDSIGLLAQSVGGGGGDGGAATAKSLAISVDPELPVLSVTTSVGGYGGAGGAGGSVSAVNGGTIVTQGDGGTAILVQSVGGGGGNGGDATAAAKAIELEAATGKLSATLGGRGGAGGFGNEAGVINGCSPSCPASISTAGSNASGILAQSIGGGGGSGGLGNAGVDTPGLASGTAISLAYGMGGSGGVAGYGGQVTVTNDAGATIATTGSGSQGVVAQSIGGGGGYAGGGAANGSADTVNVNIAVGGASSGAGNNGGMVAVTNAGTIATGRTFVLSNGAPFTTGGDAVGILAQSIGGGGGAGGSSDPAATTGTVGAIEFALQEASTQYVANIGVGGRGGSGGVGGAVSVTNTGSITTHGARAYGILAQSVGGGGGSGGAVDAAANSPFTSTYSATLGVAGGGGTAGGGQLVTVNGAGGSITTAGYGASAIVAQSIGGGGGIGAEGTVSDRTTVGVGFNYNESGGSGGNGGGVQIQGTGALSTLGDDAEAILAQSIGGGGGAASVGCTNSGVGVTLAGGISASPCFGNVGANGSFNPWRDQSSFTLSAGDRSGASGDGGGVTITVDGPIVTGGARAIGVVAQSIGGGGGFVAASAVNIASATVAATPGTNGATGGDVAVSLTASGSITTSGAGAWGILAQSIGGSGGFAADSSLPLAFPQSNTLPYQPTGVYPDSGTVSVQVGGNITTAGANAHGIVAQAIGGGGGIWGGCCLSGGGSLVAGNGGQANPFGQPNTGEAHTVTINQTAGTIRASGPGSIGIVAQASGEGTYSMPIGITIAGAVIGGTNTGYVAGNLGGPGAAGILVSGGAVNLNSPNRITVNEGGSVGTVDGVAGNAILSGYGATDVSNSGTITGSVNLNDVGVPSGQVGSLTNNPGGVLNPGPTLAAEAVTNGGTINLPGFQVNLIGDFRQTPGGDLTFGYAPSASPLLVVSGGARVAGTITPIVGTSFLPGSQTLLSAASLDVSATVAHPLLFGWDVRSADTSLALSPTANLVPAGVALTGDQSSLAAYLARAWDRADPAFGQAFAALYNNVPSAGAYVTLLNQLSPRATQVPATALVDLSGTILGSAMSCPQFEGETTLIGEARCVWAKAGGQVTNEFANDGSVTSSTYRVGGQGAVGPNWRIGAAFGAGSIWAAEGGGSKGTGQVYDGSVALKYTAGPWLVAGAVALADGSYDHTRIIDVPGIGAVLKSHSSALLIGGRLRAAYDVAGTGWYVRPMADLDLYATRTPAFTESGGPYALAVGAGSSVNVAILPAIELGGRIDFDRATVLRVYTDVGVVVTPGNHRSVSARFAGAALDDSSFRTTLRSPDVAGRLGLGVQLYGRGGFDVRTEYNLEGASSLLSQGGSLRVGFRF